MHCFSGERNIQIHQFKKSHERSAGLAKTAPDRNLDTGPNPRAETQDNSQDRLGQQVSSFLHVKDNTMVTLQSIMLLNGGQIFFSGNTCDWLRWALSRAWSLNPVLWALWDFKLALVEPCFWILCHIQPVSSLCSNNCALSIFLVHCLGGRCDTVWIAVATFLSEVNWHPRL